MCLHVKHFLHEPFIQLGKTYVEKGNTGKHELWIGAKGKAEIRHLTRFGNTFVKSGRLVQPVVNIIKTIAHQNCKENNRLFQSKFI